MRVLITKWWGVLLVDDGRVVERTPFPTDPREIARRLIAIRRGEILPEEQALAKESVLVVESRLQTLGTLAPAATLAVADGGAPDGQLLREAALLVAREETRQASAERDRFVAQSVRAMDEIQRTVNTLVERLREWYGLYYPEALRKIPDQPAFVRALSQGATRQALARIANDPAPDQSVGVDFSPDQLSALEGFARSLRDLYAERQRLEALVESETRAIAPTLCGLVGPLLAARLVSHAGSLERLAQLPSSTVQTLGAENALFLHLKEGKKPPKHGVLFMHVHVNTAPRFHRGRVSRILAGLASRAARLDFFSPDAGDRSGPLLKGLDAALSALRARARAPARPVGGRRR